ncbi:MULTISPECIES: hypothetical protein [Rhizobium]|uniref:hypothetical protein n=1 Tax=Rhizobium phaseoli TaxID=396 RepID=UPI0001903788|nr:hypothetical protein [Rhizobium phaseoli]
MQQVALDLIPAFASGDRSYRFGNSPAQRSVDYNGLKQEAVPGTSFAGSFISQAALAVLALPVLFLLRASWPWRV